MDNEDASEKAEKQEEDHEHKEESSEAVDGRLPIALCGGHGLWVWWCGILRGGLWLLSSASWREMLSNGIADERSLGCSGGEVSWSRCYIGHVHLVSASR